MSLHYNAFISYKHAPQDIKVASEVQKQLERFKIPKAIQQSTGIKKIDRIFRDKEELPLTSDLNETIRNALRNSDFQIVICSHASKQSFWVQKEIEYFLQTHTRKQILTVVVDGEPCDVVPEILQYEDREIVKEDGSVEIVRTPIEPLSCDYRMKFSQARKTELPRLAAVILGCNYDDLIQRKRQHRNRQLAAAAAAGMVCLSSLASYYAWSAAQIHENYVQSLRSQSEYLSAESQKSLDSGDRLTAMLLALESMPKNEADDRPITAAAINALVKSSYAYQTPGDDILSLYAAYIATGSIHQYLLEEDAGIVIASHSSNKLTAWDIETAMEINTIVFENMIDSISITPDNRLLVLAGSAYCYDISNWSLCWKTDFNNTLIGSAAKFTADNAAIIIADHNRFHILDSASGKLQKTLQTPAAKDGESYSIDDFDISPDQKTIAASLYQYAWNNPETFVALFDIESGKVRAENHSIPFNLTNSVNYLDDGTLIVTGASQSSGTSMTYVNSSGARYHFLYDSTELVARIDRQGKTMWNEAVTYPQQFYGTFVATCTYPTENGPRDAIICAVGNIAEIFDVESGKSIKRVDFPSIIVGMEADGNRIRCMLNNGHIAIYTYNQNVTTLEACVIGLNSAVMGRDILIQASESDRLLLYRWNIYDENLVETTNENERYQYMNYRYTAPYGMVTFDTSQYEVRYYDAVQNKLLWTYSCDKEQNYVSCIGLDSSKEAFLLFVSPKDYRQEKSILRIRLQDGTAEKISTTLMHHEINCHNGKIYYFDYDIEPQIHYISAINMADFSEERYYLPEPIYIYDLYPDKDGSLFFLTTSDSFYLFDGETLTALQEKQDTAIIEWSPDSRCLAIAYDDNLTVYDRSYQPIYSIPYNNLSLAALHWYENQLMIVYENNTLSRYDAQTGELLGTVTIDANQYRYSSTNKPVWDASQPGTLALHIGTTLNLIDTTEWKTYTTIHNCVAYFPQLQKIFVSYHVSGSGSNQAIGMFDLYDNQKLMELTRQLLSELQLSEKQKEAYGLS